MRVYEGFGTSQYLHHDQQVVERATRTANEDGGTSTDAAGGRSARDGYPLRIGEWILLGGEIIH